jgi:diphthamide synthase (EF-2-diphthine--ammonia ligase)
LLRSQLEAARLALTIVEIPFPCPNEIYEARMGAAMQDAKAAGVTHMIFGDLFLEDIRAYREGQLSKIGIDAVFPLWQKPTEALAQEMVDAGMCAHVVCVDCSKLSANFAGREFNRALLADLPRGIDPCGENGEFHTFVSAGPMFNGDVSVRVGETVERDGFAFADLLPA